MYLNSIYFGLKSSPYIGTLGTKYILFAYMGPWGSRGALAQRHLLQKPWPKPYNLGLGFMVDWELSGSSC